MSTPPGGDRFCPLPMRPRPQPGESADSYIRRLARANHLRPSYLHGYLCGPPHYLRGIRPERLVALVDRPMAVLERTLTGLSRPTRRRLPSKMNRPNRVAAKTELFAEIRRDADNGLSIRGLAARHRVHRRTIRQALTDPSPPPRKRPVRPTTVLDRVRDHIDAMLESEDDLTVRQVWERLLDDHDAEISYSTVAAHLRHRRRRLPYSQSEETP